MRHPDRQVYIGHLREAITHPFWNSDAARALLYTLSTVTIEDILQQVLSLAGEIEEAPDDLLVMGEDDPKVMVRVSPMALAGAVMTPFVRAAVVASQHPPEWYDDRTVMVDPP